VVYRKEPQLLNLSQASGRQFFVLKILQLKAYHVIFNYIMTSEPKIWLGRQTFPVALSGWSVRIQDEGGSGYWEVDQFYLTFPMFLTN